MTMNILINTEENSFEEYFVHEYHEVDMVELLKNHPNKQDVCTYTKDKKGVDWFTIKLTSEDVKKIKETSWYKNTKWDYPNLDTRLNEGTRIEVFNVEHVPKEE